MHVRLLRAKLHLARVTHARLDYHGSLTVDEDLMDAVGLLPYEAVTIANLATGARAETYVIRGERGSGEIGLNGAMARLGAPGDRLIVMAFAFLDPAEVGLHPPKIAILDEHNRIREQWVG